MSEETHCNPRKLSTLATGLLTLFSALIVLGTGAAPALSRIIGQDDRLNAIPLAFSKSKQSLGILSVEGAGGCTAFCVAPNIVATSAHCLLEESGSWRKKNMFFSFTQHLNNERVSSFLRSSGSNSTRMRVVLGTRTQALRSSSWVRSRAEDWALVKFGKNMCKTELPLAPTKDLAKTTKTSKIGMPSILYLNTQDASSGRLSTLFSTKCRFSRGVPGMPSRYQHDFLKRVGNKLNGLHNCDAQRGQSGSPILRRAKDGTLEVVAIHSGHATWCVNRKKRKSCYPFALAAQLTTMVRALERFRTETVVDDEALKAIQRALAKRRFYKGKIDGVFGPATRRAIHKYERSAKLAFLGLPTKRLMRTLGIKAHLSPEQ